MPSRVPISVVIPSYRRERVLLDTVLAVLRQSPAPAELLVVDQTDVHGPDTERALRALAEAGEIRWLRLPRPSIPRAMNVGLVASSSEVVMFLDDDIVPMDGLLKAHAAAQTEAPLVAGRVLQPWHDAAADGEEFSFVTQSRHWPREFMGGNFSIRRSVAIAMGGFDENFVRVAYRFERDFADRFLREGHRILYEPAACIRHLKAANGGTRSFGDHLRTFGPDHSVGEYYYLLRGTRVSGGIRALAARPWRAIRTRYHLSHPWWIPLTLVGELTGFLWASWMALRGPRYLADPSAEPGRQHF